MPEDGSFAAVRTDIETICSTEVDPDAVKLYVFARHLRRLLPSDREELPREVQQNIDMESYRIQQTSRGAIRLEVVRNALGDRAGTGVDPRMQVVQGKTVCLVSCQRSPEPVFLEWNGTEAHPGGDFYVPSGPRTDRLRPDSAEAYIRTRFGPQPADGSQPGTSLPLP